MPSVMSHSAALKTNLLPVPKMMYEMAVIDRETLS